MRLEFQDSIDRYVLGRMADDERTAFEEKLSESDELKEQMKLTKAVRDILERNEDLDILDRIERMDEEYDKESGEYKATGSGYERTVACPRYEEGTLRPSKRHVLYWISGIAAVFIVGFFMYNSLNVYDVAPSKQDNVAYSPRPQGISTIRGVDDEVEELLAQGDYKGALAQIDERDKDIYIELLLHEREKEARGARNKAAPKSTGKPGNDISFRGKEKNAFGKTKQEQEKKTKDVEEQEEIRYKLELLRVKQEGLAWLKVQALIGLDRMEEALLLLDKIRQSESEYREQADSLYNVLKERK